MTGISVRGVSRRYGRVQVLRDVSFDCPAGQITGLLGPNGSGKTSILTFLTDLSSGGDGTASFDGRRYGEIERPAGEIDVVLDATAHRPGRSVWETVRGAGMLIGATKEHARATVRRLGLGSVESRRFGALSLGMKQRVGLAVALLGSPRFLILDEPINGLDVESIRWLRELLVNSARDDGGTVLISSHVLQELESYADRVVILSRGQVVMEEPMDALRSAVTCEVVADDPGRLRSLLTRCGIGWRPTPNPYRISVEADSRELAQLAMDHRVLLTELVPGRTGALEDIYLRATSGEFTALGPEIVLR